MEREPRIDWKLGEEMGVMGKEVKAEAEEHGS